MDGPKERLTHAIEARGAIPFAEIMEEALYGAGGYYAREKPAIGESGDFVTGSSISPLFGRATARLLARLSMALGRPAELFEAGFGGGEHLAAVVEAASGEERIRGWDRVQRPVPEGVEAVTDLDSVAQGEIEGLVFSYELFDALPIHRLVGREDGGVGELWVAEEAEGGLAWSEGELSRPELANLLGEAKLAPGQIADLAPGWGPLYRQLARKLGKGLLVTCDYGFERDLLLDERVRRHGTLAAYRQHRVHRDVLTDLGTQDLTAHVDFSALIEAGEAEGLQTLAFTRQALWLAACGLFEDLAEASFETRHQAAVLLDGEGMGEEIRVLVQARAFDPTDVLELGLIAR